jgi:hypothetical protein
MPKKRTVRKQEASSVAVNKSAAIREELAAQGAEAASGKIIKALAARGIQVSSAHVANEKARQLRKARRLATNGLHGGNEADLSTFERTLLEAKQFVDRVGSIERAHKVLDLLAQLRK